jgi:hypothetical protein
MRKRKVTGYQEQPAGLATDSTSPSTSFLLVFQTILLLSGDIGLNSTKAYNNVIYDSGPFKSSLARKLLNQWTQIIRCFI